jgi:hypothetical protein
MRQDSPDLHLELGLESVKNVIPKRHSPALESRVKVKQNAPYSAWDVFFSSLEWQDDITLKESRIKSHVE